MCQTYLRNTFAVLSILVGLMLPAQVAAESHAIGAVTGQFAVTPSGSASYSVPIDLPEGKGGLKPSLTLVYDSNVGNGPLGVGWHIAEASSIERCALTNEEGKLIKAPNLEDTDRLCLDGVQMIAVDGEYGADGTEYRLENDNSARIVGHESINGGRNYFVLTNKAGETITYGWEPYNVVTSLTMPKADFSQGLFPFDYEANLVLPFDEMFGTTRNCHEDYSDSSSVCRFDTRWVIGTRTDKAGNFVQYQYSLGTLAGLAYQATGDSVYKVKLDGFFDSYMVEPKTMLSRPDSSHFSSKFGLTQPNGATELSKSLSVNLVTSESIEKAFEYRFEYTASNVTLRTLLSSISQCVKEACFETTQFKWNDDEIAFGQNVGFEGNSGFTPPTALSDGFNKLVEITDLNNDGFPDWVMLMAHSGITTAQTWLNTGKSWKRAPNYDIQYPLLVQVGPSEDYRKDRKGMLGDINGDSLPDVVLTRTIDGSDVTEIYLNTGSGWGSTAFQYPKPLFKGKKPRGVVVDIDGDGLAEIVFSSSEPQINTVLLNKGCSAGGCDFEESMQALPTYLFNGSGDLRYQFVDLDRDGDLDLTPKKRSADSPWKQYMNTPQGWVNGWYDSNYSGENAQLFDANADGYNDLYFNLQKLTTETEALNRALAMFGTKFFDQRIILKETSYDNMRTSSFGLILGEVTEYRKLTALYGGRNALRNNQMSVWDDQTYQPLGVSPMGYSLYQFPSKAIVAAPNFGGSAELGDFDGDGYLDIVTLDKENRLRLVLHSAFQNLHPERLRKNEIALNIAPSAETALIVAEKAAQFIKDTDIPRQFSGVVDLNNDGRPDLVIAGGGLGKQALLNTSAFGDRIEKITSPLGEQISINYGIGSDSTFVYRPPPQNRNDQHIYPTLGSARLVKSHTSSSYLGDHTVNYKYGGYRIRKHTEPHPGALGFAWMQSEDTASNLAELTVFNQQWPHVGQVDRSFSYEMAGQNPWAYLDCPNQAQHLVSCSINTYAVSNNDNGTYFSYTPRTVGYQYGDFGEKAVATITQKSAPDAFGNIEQVTTTTTDYLLNQQHSKTANSQYVNDEANWWLGRLTRTSVIHSSTETGSITKTAAFEYSPTTGILVAEITEPDQIGTPLYLRKEYEHDPYGLVKKQTLLGYHHDGTPAEPRVVETNTSYGLQDVQINRGLPSETTMQRPVKITVTTNAIGHSETVTQSLVHGGVLEQTGPNGITTKAFYDGFGRKTGELAANGVETQYLRTLPDADAPANAAYQITQRATGMPEASKYFDALGKPLRTSTIAMNGEKVFEDSEYDLLGRVTRVSRKYYANDVPVWSQSQYDAKQRLQSVTTPGADGDATISYSYASNQTTETNPLGQTTTTVKNAQGQVVKVIDNAGGVLTHQYGVTGELERTTNPAGEQIVIEHDMHNRKTAMRDPHMGHWQYGYNSFGELEWQQNARGDEITLSYDVLGRMIKRQEPEGETQWTYDHLPTQTLNDAKNQKSVGKLVKVTAPNSYLKTFSYDHYGRADSVTQSANGQHFTTATEYDELGRVHASIRPGGFIVENEYNDHGYLVAIKSPKDQQGDYDTSHLHSLLLQTMDAAIQAQEQADAMYALAAQYQAQAAQYQALADQAKAAAETYDAQIDHHFDQYERAEGTAEELRTLAAEMKQLGDEYAQQAINAFNWALDMWYQLDSMEGYEAGTQEREEAEAFLITIFQWAKRRYKTAEWLWYYAAYLDDQAIRAEADAAQATYEQQMADVGHALNQAEMLLDTIERLNAQANLIAQNLEDENYAIWWRADQTDAEGRISRSVVGNGLITESYYDSQTGVLHGRYTGSTMGDVQSSSWVYDNLYNVRAAYNDARGSSDLYRYDNLNRLQSWTHSGAGHATTAQDSNAWQYDSIGNITHSQSVGSYHYQNNALGGLRLSGTDRHGQFQYDANGNITHKGSQQFTWASFGKPLSLIGDQSVSEFTYGPDRARYQQIETYTGSSTSSDSTDNNASNQTPYTRTTHYVGKGYERITTQRATGSNVQHKYYLYAGGDLIGVHTRFGDDLPDNNTSDTASSVAPTAQTRYFHRDALGSIEAITDQKGQLIAQYRYKPFGEQVQLSDPNKINSTDPIYAAGFAPITTRGFTGHEHLNNLNLIHMNGRVYDPTLGRFLSADPNIQSPNNGQNTNRYSYVLNNPLKYTDPSGYIFKKLFGWIKKAFQWIKDNWRIIAAIAISFIPIPGMAGIGLAMMQGFAAGMVLSGGDIRAGILGALTAGAFYGVGKAFGKVKFGSVAHVKKTVMHGLVGGVSSKLGGGKFASGFWGAGFAQAFAPGIDHIDKGTLGKSISPYRVAAASIVGGTASVLGGGKFANGAVTGAFSRAFNDELHHEYEFETEICSRSSSACTADNVWESTKRNSVPFQDGPLVDGAENTIPGIGTVRTTVDDKNYTLINETKSDHYFRHGTVTRSLVVTETTISIHTVGVGSNIDYFAWGANYVASPYFKVLDTYVAADIAYFSESWW